MRSDDRRINLLTRTRATVSAAVTDCRHSKKRAATLRLPNKIESLTS
jgi:hypothetical protein